MLTRAIPLSINENTFSSEMRVWERKALLFFGDVFILIVTLYLCQISYNSELDLLTFFTHNYVSSAYALFLFLSLAFTFNLYDLEYVNKTRKVLPLAFFIGIMSAGLYAITPLLTSLLLVEKVSVFSFIIGFTATLIAWRVFYASVIHTNVFVKSFILLTAGSTDKQLLQKLKVSIEGTDNDHGLKILRIYEITPIEKQIQTLSRTIDRISAKKLIDGIIILDKDQETISSSLNTSLVKAIGNGIQVKTYIKLYEEVKEAIPLQFAGNQFYNILPISKYNHNYLYLLWHRIVDILASLFGLSIMIFLSPVILFLNIFFNKGPLFYKQLRVGKGGKEIEIIKFRSMIVEAEEHGAKMSVKGDLRVTSFGKILRNLRIDELPQFWSVLKGEMSFIGPRPERKIFIDQLIHSIPLYDSRHLIKPGITGWAQVKYGYGENIEDSCKKLEYDLYYIKNRSVTLDIRIIFKTINTVVFYKGR